MAETPSTPKKFVVVKFKQLPIESMSETQCVPNSWIKCYFDNVQVGVAFPSEMTQTNKSLMKTGKEPIQKWGVYPATIERLVNTWDKTVAEGQAPSPLVPEFENLNIDTPTASKERPKPKNLQKDINTSLENCEGDVNRSPDQLKQELTEDTAPASTKKRCSIKTQPDELLDLTIEREKILIEREKNLLVYNRKIHNLQEEKLKLEIEILKSKLNFSLYNKRGAAANDEAGASSTTVNQVDEQLLRELYETWRHMNSIMEKIFTPEYNPK